MEKTRKKKSLKCGLRKFAKKHNSPIGAKNSSREKSTATCQRALKTGQLWALQNGPL
jgi:hypothetical protein